MKYLLGFDIGSSSVKAALLDSVSGKAVASAQSPVAEMPIASLQPGFAEQDPEMWWQELLNAVNKLHIQFSFSGDDVAAIGISYQMHGLVCVNKDLEPLRPAIIWCDSRAVDIGNKAFRDLGEEFCLQNFLNSPVNFTASKLKWVKDHEPRIYEQIYKIMLPGDFIALKLTGQAATSISGLSEGIMWNFKENAIAADLLKYYGISEDLLPPILPNFGEQGRLTARSANALKLVQGIPVCYRAGDQPNNAYSLNVLQPGEIAATAGTSGVVYGVTDKINYDRQSRVNTFVHVNHSLDQPRYGVLLCVNGTGILNSWLRKNFFPDLSYEQIDGKASKVAVGSEGVQVYPFGNGAERILQNKDAGFFFRGLHFNRHHRGHVARAAQEGIVFALNYGMEVMQQMSLELKTIRAGHANMFLSDVFTSTFANITGCLVELYNTDGALGAARAAGVGVGIFSSFAESFKGMEIVKRAEPEKESVKQTEEAYQSWKKNLNLIINY